MNENEFVWFVIIIGITVLITALAFSFIPQAPNEKLATEVCQIITNSSSMKGHLDLWNSRIICSPINSYSNAYERIIIKGERKEYVGP